MSRQIPRTKAGLRLLARSFDAGIDADPEWVIAIENEMYDLASNEGYHAGIADCKAHAPEHGVERLLRQVIEDREHHGDCPAFDMDSTEDCSCGLRDALSYLDRSGVPK